MQPAAVVHRAVRPAPALQYDRDAMLALKADMALVVILAKGNDYLPAMRGVTLDASGEGPGLWQR